MADSQMVMSDRGAANARIMAKETRVDARRVEGASVKVRTHLSSAEAKRLFVRVFQTLQVNAHFISVIARTRLDPLEIEAKETSLRAGIDRVKQKLGAALDDAEAQFKAHGISSLATYDTQPLEVEVGILSSSGRRYLEVFNMFDQLIPLWQTLEINEVISVQMLDQQRVELKREIKGIATSAREIAAGLRRRMTALQNPSHVQPGAQEDDERDDEAGLDSLEPGRLVPAVVLEAVEGAGGAASSTDTEPVSVGAAERP